MPPLHLGLLGLHVLLLWMGRAAVVGTFMDGETSCRLNCHCCLVPCEPLWLGGWSYVCLLPCCYQVLWDCALSCCGWGFRISGTVSSFLLILPSLCIPVHPPLHVQMCGILQHPGVLGQVIFVELRIFTGCSLKRRDKESISRSTVMLMAPLSTSMTAN